MFEFVKVKGAVGCLSKIIIWGEQFEDQRFKFGIGHRVDPRLFISIKRRLGAVVRNKADRIEADVLGPPICLRAVKNDSILTNVRERKSAVCNHTDIERVGLEFNAITINWAEDRVGTKSGRSLSGRSSEIFSVKASRASIPNLRGSGVLRPDSPFRQTSYRARNLRWVPTRCFEKPLSSPVGSEFDPQQQ
jgi:hypothetical protein